MVKHVAIALKNHTIVRIRSISLEDAVARHRFFVELSLAQQGMVHTTEEIDFHSLESYEQIRDFLYNKRGLWLVAIDIQDNIVAEVDITIKNLARVRHNGQLTIGVSPAWQGLGLGAAMMEQAIAWAIAHRLLRIELSVLTATWERKTSTTSSALWSRVSEKNYLRHVDNSFEDDIIMAKYL